MDTDILREKLAEIAHEQWMFWASDVASTGLSQERLARWKTYMIPYEKLSEEVKEYDRVWADRIILTLIQMLGEQNL
jgi:hypothetical protein